MNCFIRSLQLITQKNEEELRALVEKSGVRYEDLLPKGMRLEQAYQIMHDQGFNFYSNFNLRENITVTNPIFDKGEFVFIYDDHAIGSVNRCYSDKGRIKFDRVMIGFFYRPQKLSSSILDAILNARHFNKLKYIGHGENRVVFQGDDKLFIKIAITESGHEENIYDISQSQEEYYADCIYGNDLFIIQEELDKDTDKIFLNEMTKLAEQKGYDKVQYGVKNGVPKFYDGKISCKSAETYKLQFDKRDVSILMKWIVAGDYLPFIEYYRRNA